MDHSEQKSAIPMGGLFFMFSTSCFILWGIYQGIFGGEIRLLYGLFGLVMYPVYLIGGICCLKEKNVYFGNIYFIFGVVFNGMMAFGNLAMFFSDQFGWGYDPSILGIPLIVSGIGVTISMIPYRFAPRVSFIVWGLASVWIFTAGIEMMGVLALMTLNKIMAFLVASGVAYLMIDELLKSAGGKGLPLGPSLFKEKVIN